MPARRCRDLVQFLTPIPLAKREVVDAFLAASRNGDCDALVALLAPDVVLRADSVAVRTGSPEEVRGATAIAGSSRSSGELTWA